MPGWLKSIWQRKNFENVIAGIDDDDCAVLNLNEEQIVISTDYLNASPIALELGLGSYWDLGRLLVAANLSDLCGSGALPLGFLASIMMKKEEADEESFKQLMKGIIYELDRYNIPLIGGDSKLGKSLTLCGTILGKKEKDSNLFFKNKAKIKDHIWVSGKIGGVGAAIDAINMGITQSYNWAKDKIINPSVPLKRSRQLSKMRVVNGGTDISDGLGADLVNLCASSIVGAEIYVENIPVDDEVRYISNEKKISPWMYSFTIGGDFQFLVTVPPEHDRLLYDLGFYHIGEITSDPECYLIVEKQKFLMPKKGHRDIHSSSFSQEMEFLLDQVKYDKKD